MKVEIPPTSVMAARFGRKWSSMTPDVLPAWIADMDFLPAPAIRDSLAKALALGDLGYGPVGPKTGLPEAFARWAGKRWGWEVDPAWVRLAPDVVGSLANCIEALTEPGEAVLVQTPIYPPFRNLVTAGGRRLVEHALDADGHMDFAGLEKTLRRDRVRLVLFCNPHNPSGRCFTEEELARFGELAVAYDLAVVSDEVHADLVFAPHRHRPFASLSDLLAKRTVTLNSASKAFNLAGLRTAVCVASDPELRRKLDVLPATRWNAFSTLGVRAALAAWSDEGEAWLEACVDHLALMRGVLDHRLRRDLPEIAWTPPEASYLAWLDCRPLGLGDEPEPFFLEHAKVALSAGPDFGAPGLGHARLNFATSPAVLHAMLDRMAEALAQR